MFYSDTPSSGLRFGDVISGFPLSSSLIKKPISSLNEEYNIVTNISKYTVILDPSCSIGDEKISLSPLKQIPKKFFDNPKLQKNLLILNQYMSPQLGIHPQEWNTYSTEKKIEILNQENGYTNLNYFIYDAHKLLDEYNVKSSVKYEEIIGEDEIIAYKVKKEDVNYLTSAYILDFKEIYHVKCDKIVDQNTQQTSEEILGAKILELSQEYRKMLGEKLNTYFARILNEDD